MTSEQLIALVPVAVVLLTLLGGFVTWMLNERSKRRWEEYRRKEARYVELVSRLRGFSVESGSPELRNQFLDHLNLAWLYCSDDVIRKAYRFLETIHVGAGAGPSQQELSQRRLGELMVAIRTDLLQRRPISRTSLDPNQFQMLRGL